jgi:hypothetical protein
MRWWMKRYTNEKQGLELNSLTVAIEKAIFTKRI